MNGHVISPCEFSMERYKNIAKWRNMWTILLFVFGTTVIVFLSGSIFLFINKGWLPGAIATLGTVVNGVGVSWVVTRRNEAVQEEGQAYQDVRAVCGAGGDTAKVEASLAEFQDKQKVLFRAFR